MTTDLPLIALARSYRGRSAITDTQGSYTYADLLAASARVSGCLLEDQADLEEARVAFLCPPNVHYVATQWGIWRAGGVAVPMCDTHPPAELGHVLDDAEPAVVVAHPDLAGSVRPLAEARRIRFVTTPEALDAPAPATSPSVAETRRALMVYTSGTTGRPKGAVTTHANVRTQVTALIEAWGWHHDDRILLVLPLHHVHGVINVLACALWAGAHCEMLPRFDAEAVWSRFAAGGLSLFMAVPSVYHRLIAAWDAAPAERRAAMSAGCAGMRLMVSGSAALPVVTLDRWKAITGHVLLERYGMTEIGMALSNPLDGERVPGTVGGPLPDVELRLVDDQWHDVPAGEPGTILVRGPGVFLEYWRRPEETRDAFHDGWFVTGDIAAEENGRYRILGRRDVDMIMTGGYKVSALEIEEALRDHPDIAECAVVGVGDPEWGERVCAAVEVRGAGSLTLDAVRQWAKERLAPYKVPRSLRTVDALPRNTVGKVTKADVAGLFAGDA